MIKGKLIFVIVSFIYMAIPTNGQGRKKLIVDTDGVADDVKAITMAIHHPDVEIIAITVTTGCVSHEQAAINVFRTLVANGVEEAIPIYAGGGRPIHKNDITCEFLFGKDGLSDTPETIPKVDDDEFLNFIEDAHAVEALIKLTEQKNVTIVALGPLTNIALALKMYPEFATQPEAIVLMGGNYLAVGNVQSNRTDEFNFHGDPDAAAIVLSEMQVPITVVPWEAFYAEGAEYEKQINFTLYLLYPTYQSQFLYNVTALPRQFMDVAGQQYKFCDEIAMATAIDMKKVVNGSAQLNVNVDLHGRYTRGQIAVEWQSTHWPQDGPKTKRETPKRRLITFVTSYNVFQVDEWMHTATSATSFPHHIYTPKFRTDKKIKGNAMQLKLCKELQLAQSIILTLFVFFVNLK